jgi:hypothetical protein
MDLSLMHITDLSSFGISYLDDMQEYRYVSSAEAVMLNEMSIK